MRYRTTLWMTTVALTLMTGYASAQNNPLKEESTPSAVQSMHNKDGDHLGRRLKHHLQKLKADLKLSADQEPAWVALTSAMASPVRPSHPPQADMEKLSMPERLEKMKLLMTQFHEVRMAELEKHAAAVKTFYAVLTPEQKKIFDARAMPGWMHRGPHD